MVEAEPVPEATVVTVFKVQAVSASFVGCFGGVEGAAIGRIGFSCRRNKMLQNLRKPPKILRGMKNTTALNRRNIFDSLTGEGLRMGEGKTRVNLQLPALRAFKWYFAMCSQPK